MLGSCNMTFVGHHRRLMCANFDFPEPSISIDRMARYGETELSISPTHAIVRRASCPFLSA